MYGKIAIEVKKSSNTPCYDKDKEVMFVHTIEQVKAIQRVQDYIKNHLMETITLRDLANAAGYSPSHTERLFKEIVSQNLFDYLRSMRLTEAAKELKDNHKQRIIDVSLNYLFDSHEGFTRAFSKAFGIAPKTYQKKPIPLKYFISFDVLGTYLLKTRKKENNMKTKTIFCQVVERPKRKAIIKRGLTACEYFKYCDEVGCEVWGILESIPDALYEPAGFWLPQHLIKHGTSTYVQGVELSVDFQGEVPEGFELIELDPGLMMIFQGEPYENENFRDAIGEIWNHIESFDPKLYGYTWDSNGIRFQLEPRGYRGYIEGRPVKKVV